MPAGQRLPALPQTLIFFFYGVTFLSSQGCISQPPLWPGVATWLVLIKGCHASKSDSEAGASLLASLISPGCWHLSSHGNAMHCKWRSHGGPGLVLTVKSLSHSSLPKKKKKDSILEFWGKSLCKFPDLTPPPASQSDPRSGSPDLTFRTFELSPGNGNQSEPVASPGNENQSETNT